MKNLFRAIALLLILCATAFSAEYRPGVVLVKYRPGTDDAAITELQARKGMTLTKKIKLFGIHVYSFDEARGTSVAFAEEVAREAIVLNAEPDLVREAKAADPEYPNQWSLNNTGQLVNGKTGPAGIDIRWPAANLIYQPKSTLLVAVIDSGVTLLHPDLAGSIHSKPGESGSAFNNGIDDEQNDLIDDVWGYDWYSQDPLPLDQNGHGTLVASIIAGTIGNGKGISGITNSVKVRSFRIFDQFGRGGRPKFRTASGASVSDGLASIATAVDDGCKILNLSYGGSGYSQLEADAYNLLGGHDVLLIAAAGNEANNNDQSPSYPASYAAACIISVAAQDRTGGLASFSNYGPVSTDLAAPGTDIRGADVTRRTIYSSLFSSGMNGWSAYRVTASDYSYAAWTTSGGYLVDRTYGSTYAPWTDTFARSPLIDASIYSGVRIEYDGMYDLANDIGSVDLSTNGLSWDSYRSFTADGSGMDQLDASDYDFTRFYLRFRLRSDGYSQGVGIAVQGVKVSAINDLDVNNPSYQYSSGTSFAAPVVAGVAAMVWTHQPSLTAAQVKEVLMNSVRRLPQLDGKVLTGGMVDAEAALRLADVYAGNAVPSVLTPPRGGSFLEGNSLTLGVAVTQNLPVTYQWRKNGVNISGARSATFVIGALQISDSGSYDVVVTSTAGSVTSSAAQVTVSAKPPAFVVQPSSPSPTMVAGQPYQFSCTVSGTPPFAYQWMKNGLAITGANSASYSFASLTAADAGSYAVRVTNAAGFVLSNSVVVSVSVLPSFTLNLPTAPISLVAGSSRMIYVLATGVPVPTYQWRKNGVNIPGATLYYYTALAGPTEGANTYDVVITNSAGSATSAAATVTTNVPVTVASAPVARNVVAGASASFSVTAAGTGPFTYQWLKNGLVIAGATGSTYSVASATAADAGIYSVRVTGPVGPVTSVGATLSVLGFSVNLPTAPIELTAGTARALSVAATGVPAPTFQWRRNGVNIPGAIGAAYVALAGTVEGSNTYDVVITNSAGSATSAAATIRTNVPVTVASAPAARNVVAGASASFSVTAAGTGPFTYQWLKNGLAIAGATASTYDIASATAADAGIYSVRVTGPVGPVTSVGATLSVIAPFTISAQPLGGLTSVNVVSGGSTVLSVVPAGVGPFAYQWRKDGVNISGATLSSYVAWAGTTEGAASYDVLITGPVSAMASNSVRISTCLPVVISRQPVSIVRAVGQPAAFTVTATGTGPFTYQWLKNGINIAGATASSYSLASVGAGDAAIYSVRVSGPVGGATSATAALSLNVVPTVSTQPLDAYKALGQSATFSVVPAGTGPFTYQWSKDGVSIAGANASTYSIAVIGVNDAGKYSVSVANAVGSVLSREAELVIVTVPAILIQPTMINSAGSSGTRSHRSRYFGFNHGADGWSVVPWSGKDLEWPTTGWYWNDQIDEGLTESNLEGAVGGGTTVSPLISLAGLTSPELRFRIASMGSVTIHASSDKVSWTLLSNMPAGANFLNDPMTVSLAAFAGSSCYLRFTCTSGTWLDEVEIWGTGLAKEIVELSVYAEGQGLSYQWFKDGVAIAGATSRGYLIPDAIVATTAGSYAVRVSNAAGSVTSAVARVGVAPSIASQPVAQFKAAGQSAVFSVVATGTGPLAYQWYKDGAALAGASSATYSIASVGSQHVGTYSVTITNGLGQVTSQQVLLAVTLPPTITNQPASYAVPSESEGVYPDTTFDFESGLQGWVASAGPNNRATANWVHTVSSGGGGTVRGLYCDNSSSSSAERYIISPRIDLGGITAPFVSYKSGYTSYTGVTQGTMTLEASSDGVNWSYVSTAPSAGSPFTGAGVGQATATLTEYAGGGVYLRFKASGPQTGFWLDDVVISGHRYPSGKAYTFSVSASGEGNSYQWLKNGVIIAGATAASFKVDDVRSPAALGSYSVRVTNAAGSVTSAQALLSVSAPTIISQPQSYVNSWPSASREVVLRNRFDLGAEGWGPVGRGYPGWLWNDQRFDDEAGDADASSLEGNGSITSPLISLAGVTGSAVKFDLSVYGGVGVLAVSLDGSNWATLASYDGSTPAGSGTKTVSLASYDGRSVYLRFVMPASGGALIDNVEVAGNSRAHTMTAAVAGVGCTYQWFRNGVAIAGATSASYRVADVALASSAGSYTVRVTNPAGSVVSNAAVIPAFTAPVIVSQPASLSVIGTTSSVYALRNFTFDAGAEGWTYGANGANMSFYNWGWDSVAGAITDRLSGSIYASNTDTFTQSPWISFLGASSPVLSFTAYHDLYPDALDVLEVQASSNGINWTTLKSIYGSGSGVYTVSLAGYQFAGGCYLRYRLRTSPLFNAWGVLIYDTVVAGTVISPGQPASFSVSVASSAGCTFQWYKDNVAISGATSASYYIPSAYASDAGVYRVVVTNPVGSVSSTSATLTVR